MMNEVKNQRATVKEFTPFLLKATKPHFGFRISDFGFASSFLIPHS